MNKQTANSDEWETPGWLFKALDVEFWFTFDAAASDSNAKCSRYATDIAWAVKEGAITSTDTVFCNPPYSMISMFVLAALESPAPWVLLLPSRTDNGWFPRLVNNNDQRVELRWFRKRIKFLENGEEMGSPRFASMLAIVR